MDPQTIINYIAVIRNFCFSCNLQINYLICLNNNNLFLISIP